MHWVICLFSDTLQYFPELQSPFPNPEYEFPRVYNVTPYQRCNYFKRHKCPKWLTPIGERAHEHFQDKDSKYNMTTRTLSLTHVTLYKQLAFHRRWTVVRSVRDFGVLTIWTHCVYGSRARALCCKRQVKTLAGHRNQLVPAGRPVALTFGGRSTAEEPHCTEMNWQTEPYTHTHTHISNSISRLRGVGIYAACCDCCCQQKHHQQQRDGSKEVGVVAVSVSCLPCRLFTRLLLWWARHPGFLVSRLRLLSCSSGQRMRHDTYTYWEKCAV